MDGSDQIQWILADGSFVELPTAAVTQLQAATIALQSRGDIDPRQKGEVAFAVASLGRKLGAMASNLPEQTDIDATADALALAANTKAARMDALRVGCFMKRFAAEMLKALPVDAVSPSELESLEAEISKDRASIAQRFQDLQEEIDPQSWRTKQDTSTEN